MTSGQQSGVYRTVQYIGANMAVVVLQIAAGPVFDGDGFRKVGIFISIVGVALLVEAFWSRTIRVRVE